MSEMKNDILKNLHDLTDEKLSSYEATMQNINRARSSIKLLTSLSEASSLTLFDQEAEDSQSMTAMPMFYTDALVKSPPHKHAPTLRPRPGNCNLVLFLLK